MQALDALAKPSASADDFAQRHVLFWSASTWLAPGAISTESVLPPVRL